MNDPLWMRVLKSHTEAKNDFISWLLDRSTSKELQVLSSVKGESYTAAQRDLGARDELVTMLSVFTESDREAVRTGGKK
jgi:hypothetical protein